MAREELPLRLSDGLDLRGVSVEGTVRGGSACFSLVARGKCSSKILMIAARCVPASTAKMEPFVQLVAVERTSKPVTLSSLGPPPAPWIPEVKSAYMHENRRG